MKKINSNQIKIYNILFFASLILLLNNIYSKKIQKIRALEENIFSKEYINLFNFVIMNNGHINPKLIPNESLNINRYTYNSKRKNKKRWNITFYPGWYFNIKIT